jgi:hypothetical protein
MLENPDTPVRVVCAWCGAVIVDEPPGPSGEVSHGICSVCESNFDFCEDEKSDYEIVKKALS